MHFLLGGEHASDQMAEAHGSREPVFFSGLHALDHAAEPPGGVSRHPNNERPVDSRPLDAHTGMIDEACHRSVNTT